MPRNSIKTLLAPKRHCNYNWQLQASLHNCNKMAATNDHETGRELINDEQHQDETLQNLIANSRQPTAEHHCRDAHILQLHQAHPLREMSRKQLHNNCRKQGQEGRKTKVKPLRLAAHRPRRAQTLPRMLQRVPVQTLPT